MRYFWIGIVVWLLSACMNSAMNLREGIKSFQVQDYRQAFIRLKPEAQKGTPEAQYAVGFMYYYGQGIIEDRRKAWYWITEAAKNGNQDAKAAMVVLKKHSGRVDPT